ncbi:hypothetical protein BGX38DRAFT_1269170 [Terfezia claveryi]|nr:hypothetical protein BGX38DRAFT_1269170 [Terfezia claveryi]
MPSPTYICPPCRRLLLTTPRLLHKRFTHTHLPAPTSPPLQSGLINLSLPSSPATTTTDKPPPRALISLHGPDATKFLQAVTTIDIPPLTTTSPASAYSGFLNAQGRLLWEGFVYNVNGSKGWRKRIGEESIGAGAVRGKWGVDDPCWFVETSGGGAEGLRKWLGRYVLRSKVSITPVPTVGMAGGTGWDVWVAWGTGEKLLSEEVVNFESIPRTNDNRAPGLFTRYLLPTRPPSDIDIPEGGGSGATLSDYHLRRYLHGIAESPPEFTPPERSLPHEYNFDLYPPPHGLSFHKGCYVGQELTVRTQHRGVVRKRVIPVQLSSLSIPAHHGGIVYDPTAELELPPPGEAEIVSCHSQVHEGGGGRARNAGRFIAGIGNVGIALVRLESVFGQGWEGEVGTREGGRWGGRGLRLCGRRRWAGVREGRWRRG